MSEKERFLAENGYYVTSPAGDSMRPFIIGGRDVVVVIPLDLPPKKYDAVFYRRENGEHVIHRMVGKRGELYLLRGDNCYYTEAVPQDALIGLARRVMREGREISLNSHRGYRTAVFLWCGIYPLRLALHFFKRGAGWLKRNVFGRKNENGKRA